jgi:uncharacterized membrane protein
MPRLERGIGHVLLAGMCVSAALLIIGGALYLTNHGTASADFSAFRELPHAYEQVGGVLNESLRWSGRGIIQLGILLLVAVQVIRVAMTLWLFKSQRDRRFVWISLAVLIGLLYSLFGSH